MVLESDSTDPPAAKKAKTELEEENADKNGAADSDKVKSCCRACMGVLQEHIMAPILKDVRIKFKNVFVFSSAHF